MSLFVCDECGCVENTAPTRFWLRKEGDPALCSQCDPEIGFWHGLFPRRKPNAGDIENGRFIHPKAEDFA